MEDKKWNEDKIIENLRKIAETEQIPESLEPEQIKECLEEKDSEKEKKKKRSYKWWYGTAAAACLAVVLLAAGKSGFLTSEDEASRATEGKETGSEEKTGTTYKELYQTFSKIWDEQDTFTYGTIKQTEGKGIASDTEMSDGTEEGSADHTTAVEDSSAKKESSPESASGDYGKTNQQEVEVEEADIIKNDGRYLYQVVSSQKDNQYAVQIVDTKNGLKEKSRVGTFENIQNIYVWKDKLVILETGFVQSEEPKYEEEGKIGGVSPLYDVEYLEDSIPFTRIHIYDMENRAKPKEYHTFTVKGTYRDSRISDGYLYLFAQDDANRTKKEEDYESYIPLLDDQPIEEDCIYLPEDVKEDSYLVMVSVNMEQPDEFTDTKAIVTGADQFYVSQQNIYVTDVLQSDEEAEGENSNCTKIYRFSYKNGKMKREAEGSVKGILTDDMAMNEYQGYLRMVTTVDSYQTEKVTEDVFGQDLGYLTTDYKTSNSLYVLDENLKVSGKIEDLAEDEQIYSARFMGNAGYFVTFRETDPLFSVDLSNPKKPKILGELKISGFSEYLHFYTDELLLGIGMEAETETGITQGMKLSIFNIADPSDVKEESRLDLSEYDSAEALYDYKAVLIDTQKNLFGFLAEGYGEETIRDYLLFSYENGEFQQRLKIDCSDYDKYTDQIRGTYIGDSFYLLCQNGRIQEYALKDGSLTGELEP